MSAVLDHVEASLRMEVVPFEPKYEAQVLQLAREMHAESVVHRGLPLNEKKLLAQLRGPITHPDMYFRLAVRGDEVFGGFFGMISTLYFSDDRMAKDMAWFVKRESRGTYAAIKLLADFEKWALAKGVRKFMLGQSTGVQIETTKALYERLGYRSVGFNTFKEC